MSPTVARKVYIPVSWLVCMMLAGCDWGAGASGSSSSSSAASSATSSASSSASSGSVSSSSSSSVSSAASSSSSTAAVAPLITTNPANQSVTQPATATFIITVTGAPTPTLQWQISTNAGSTWSDIVGATSASYVTPATSVTDSGKRYRVIATNSAGSAVSNAATLTVTAPSSSKNWQAPLLISDTGTLAYDTYSYQIAANDLGDAIAVWTKVDTSGYRIQANRYRSGTGWQGVETIGMAATGSGKTLNAPRAAIARNGNAVVVWEVINDFGFGNPTRGDIVSNYYDRLTGWGAVLPVETDDGAGGFLASAGTPSVTIADNGVAVAAWLQQKVNDSVSSVMTATSGGTGWSVPSVGFTDAVARVGGVQIAGNGAGDVVVVWLGRDNGLFHPYAALISGGTQSSAAVLDNDPSIETNPPAVAVMANGDAVVAWSRQGSGNVMVNERINGSWQGAIRRNGTFDGFLNTTTPPKVVAGSAGNALVIWPGAGFGGSSGDFVATRAPGGWTAGQMLIASNSGGGLDAAINLSGQTLAAWTGTGAPSVVRATSGYNLNLGVNSTLSTNGAGAKIALGGDGTGLAVWIQADGTANRLWAAEFR